MYVKKYCHTIKKKFMKVSYSCNIDDDINHFVKSVGPIGIFTQDLTFRLVQSFLWLQFMILRSKNVVGYYTEDSYQSCLCHTKTQLRNGITRHTLTVVNMVLDNQCLHYNLSLIALPMLHSQMHTMLLQMVLL